MFNQSLSPLPRTPIYSLPMTLFLSSVLLVVFFISQILGIFLFTPYVLSNSHQLDVANRLAMGNDNGTVMSLSVIFTFIMIVSCVGLLIKCKKGAKLIDYLAITPFHWSQLLRCGLLLIAINMIAETMFIWLEREPMLFVDSLYETAKPIWLLILAMVVFAPLYEEIMFRGFMWVGFANSQVGFWGASVITSLVFAIVHLQYGLVEMATIVVLAMLFSYARAISGSLLLPIVLHIINNGLAMGQYLLKT